MQVRQVGRWGRAALLGLLMSTGSATAGGPIVFNEADGRTFPWRDNRAVYVVETGRLGAIENPQAAALVAQAFQRWTNVPTANLRVENLEGILLAEALAPFRKDITVEDFALVTCAVPELGEPFPVQRILCEAITACIAQGGVNCPSPIILDEDGSITAAFIGEENPGTLGFSGPLFLSPPDDPVQPFRTLQAFTVLNGDFFDADLQNSFGSDDPTGTLFLEAVMVHEFGHFLGLGHSEVNGATALLNPAVDRVGTTTVNRAIGPVDGLVTVRAEDVETMYPVILQRAIDGISPLNTLERDDEAALSALYPNETALSPTGTVAGSIFIPCAAEDETAGICIAGADGRRVKRAQGVLVTARRFEPSSPNPDLDGDAVPDPRVLKEAVSQLTGVTFAPLRCITPNRLQIFGACSTLGSVEECSQTLENFGVATQCGFFSSGFSAPRPVGDAAENRFELTDLPPGQYIVEATQVFTGGFSSPVLSNFSATPLIVSDDNRGFAFFPNPQTGEFYNGLPNGCGSPTAICGGESGSVPDNPFAYTIIEVTAGGRVEDVNIVLNTTTTATNFLSTPGFNFCGLGDVNGDAIVDQRDVQKVATARAAFEKAQRRSRKKVRRVLRRNPRSDLNQDSSITAFDVDIITDIVTLPEFTGKDINRALAPFAAICTAARDGGCSIQAPTAATRNDGTVLLPVCDTAMDIGCSVIGCQPFQPVGCTAISVPAEQNGELSLSDPASFIRTDSFADCYTFSGTAGQPLVIRLQSQNFDTVLTLIGPDGQIVDSNDDCPGDGVNSCIPSGALSGQVVSLPSTGTYTIEVTSFAPQATGGYSLTVSDEPFNPQPGSTTAEGALASSDQVLGDGSFADPFTFTGNAGQQVSFRLQSTEFDTFLLLVGPDGQAVDANDNCPGDGTNSCIPSNTLSGGLLSLPSDGTYIVVVNSVAPGATGGYTLTASGGISIQPLSP